MKLRTTDFRPACLGFAFVCFATNSYALDISPSQFPRISTFAPKIEAHEEAAASKKEASVNFFTSQTGTEIAWFATLFSLIFAIIPLLLLVSERKKSRLLNDIMNRFEIKESIDRQAQEASNSKNITDKALRESKEELSKLSAEIESNIPIQARAAFYNAAIPEIENQINYLIEQREVMVTELKRTGVSDTQSMKLKKILEVEISATIVARRKLDEKQTILSIFSGFAAASAILDVFQPIGYPVSAALGFTIIWIAYDLGKQWALVYPKSRLASFINSKFYRFIPIFLGTTLFVFFVAASIYIYYRRFYFRGFYF